MDEITKLKAEMFDLSQQHASIAAQLQQGQQMMQGIERELIGKQARLTALTEAAKSNGEAIESRISE